MMSNQIKMNELIDKFLDFCCKLENKNPGITNFVLKQQDMLIYINQWKVFEDKLDQLYLEDKYLDFNLLLNQYRNLWMIAVGKLRSA